MATSSRASGDNGTSRVGELMYYVISASPDGIYVNQYTKEELEKSLADPDEYGGQNILPVLSKSDSDPNTWGNSILIIKGEVVIPKPIQVVKRFELP